jgi:2-phospho-L-lactate guanylyltransferase (CobY/MobA/RfbA family)
LNVALDAARLRLAPVRLLVALADLPYVTSADIEILHDRLGEQPGVVVAPDEAGQGTNLMLLSPALAVPFCYGPMSCPRHVAAAKERGLAATLLSPGRTGIDIDTPADLARMTCS